MQTFVQNLELEQNLGDYHWKRKLIAVRAATGMNFMVVKRDMKPNSKIEKVEFAQEYLK